MATTDGQKPRTAAEYLKAKLPFRLQVVVSPTAPLAEQSKAMRTVFQQWNSLQPSAPGWVAVPDFRPAEGIFGLHIKPPVAGKSPAATEDSVAGWIAAAALAILGGTLIGILAAEAAKPGQPPKPGKPGPSAKQQPKRAGSKGQAA